MGVTIRLPVYAGLKDMYLAFSLTLDTLLVP